MSYPLRPRCSAGFHNTNPTVTSKDFRFGVKSGSDEKDVVKKSLFPRGTEPNSEEVDKMYITSHNSWAPEQQIRRNYNWPKEINLQTHAFGTKDHAGSILSGNGVASCLNPVDVTTNKEGFNPTRLVNKMSEDYRRVTQPAVGEPRSRGQGRPPVPADFAFGYRPAVDTLTSETIIRGALSAKETAPDHDLEVNSRIANEPRKLSAPAHVLENRGRAFGIPSVRTDISAPKRRSVSDEMNYGDELTAGALIRNERFADLGVSDSEFSKKREKEEVRSLVQSSMCRPVATTTKANETSAGQQPYLPCDFEEIFDLAQRVQTLYDTHGAQMEPPSEMVSLQAFIAATGKLLDHRVAVENDALSLRLGVNMY